MMNCKGFGRKGLWAAFKELSRIFLEALLKTTKTSLRIAGLRADI
jgi:hypothetical protein